MNPTVFKRKQEALKWLAYARLKWLNKSTSLENISKEKSRIERVISDIYTYTKPSIETEYNQYILDFIKEHGREIVYDTTYAYDIQLPDEIYEINLDVITDKFNRKKAGAKY